MVLTYFKGEIIMKKIINTFKNIWAFIKSFVISFTTVITFILIYSMYVLYQETHIIDTGFIILCITLIINGMISMKYFLELNYGIIKTLIKRKKSK